MYLNIILQLLIGISALFIVYLDYKWYDKRKTIFKKARKILIIITVTIICLSIVATINQEKEKSKLSGDISTMQDSISSINVIAKNLNEQIEPFLKLALEKYPNMPTNEALNKFQLEIKEIQKKTKGLELKEQNRKDKETEFEILKNTSPDVEFEMGLIKNDLKIFVKFNNQVPIKFDPFLQGGVLEYLTNNPYDFFRRVHLEPIVIYPSTEKHKRSEFIYDSIEKDKKLPKDKLLILRMKIRYSSIYMNEIQSSKLKEKEINLDYLLNTNTHKLIPFKF